MQLRLNKKQMLKTINFPNDFFGILFIIKIH